MDTHKLESVEGDQSGHKKKENERARGTHRLLSSGRDKVSTSKESEREALTSCRVWGEDE